MGFLVVAAVATLNATRRNVNDLVDNTWLEWIEGWTETWAESALIGLLILSAVTIALRRFPRRGRAQYVAVAIAVAVSTLIAGVGALAWETQGTFQPDFRNTGPMSPTWAVVAFMLRYGLLAALTAGAWLYFRGERENAATAHELEIEAARLEEQAAESRLQVLEAQIEPHFLFNALATVRRLYGTDPGAGDRMLDNMMRYLSIALPQMRASDSTLGREVALVEAYLEIQRIRMGSRLAYRIEVPEALRRAALPPLMLPTLVENAIKHGVGPLPQGGAIVVRAHADATAIRVDVADNGRGFTASSGAGAGLANLRARLAARFGEQGELSLSPGHPSGLTVTIRLPLAMTPAAP